MGASLLARLNLYINPPFHYVSKIQTNLSLICIPNNNEQRCQLSPIIQETPDFGPYLPDNHPSLPFLQKTQLSDNEISNILHCLSYFSVNIEHFLIHSNMQLSYKQ